MGTQPLGAAYPGKGTYAHCAVPMGIAAVPYESFPMFTLVYRLSAPWLAGRKN